MCFTHRLSVGSSYDIYRWDSVAEALTYSDEYKTLIAEATKIEDKSRPEAKKSSFFRATRSQSLDGAIFTYLCT